MPRAAALLSKIPHLDRPEHRNQATRTIEDLPLPEPAILEIIAIIVLGIGAQWLAWHIQLPSILLLLCLGFLAGPITGYLDADRLLGDLLLPIVSISVAVILFEGGLSLNVLDLSLIRQSWSRSSALAYWSHGLWAPQRLFHCWLAV